VTFWQEPANPYDLGPASFRGPCEKPRSEGGVGKKKPNRRRTSPLRVAEVRARKVAGQKCRVCWDTENLHAHHIVRRGAPWFGEWTEDNIAPLCEACHRDLHAGRAAVKQILRSSLTAAEVRYADDRAYPGYVDEVLWPLRELGANPGTLAGGERS
jgi:hypothetical protein